MRDLLTPHIGSITTDTVKMALFDDFATPYSVCRPPRPGLLTNNLSATVAMIVMEPASGTMDVAMLPALNRTFQRFTLGGMAKLRAAE